ncbi:hypothetical protein F4680DRAFT_66822 [Xylaria scruposa]|nr:hypothetical protein F4680DRAFT_66822 [Xylaria scruposa]
MFVIFTCFSSCLASSHWCLSDVRPGTRVACSGLNYSYFGDHHLTIVANCLTCLNAQPARHTNDRLLGGQQLKPPFCGRLHMLSNHTSLGLWETLTSPIDVADASARHITDGHCRQFGMQSSRVGHGAGIALHKVRSYKHLSGYNSSNGRSPQRADRCYLTSNGAGVEIRRASRDLK